MRCFNCGTTENVQRYAFDLDLPTVDACQVCVYALSVGDVDLLKAMRPRRPSKRGAVWDGPGGVAPAPPAGHTDGSR